MIDKKRQEEGHLPDIWRFDAHRYRASCLFGDSGWMPFSLIVVKVQTISGVLDKSSQQVCKQIGSAMREFTNTQKITCFNQLAKRCFNHNFGTLSKSDFDELMFGFYYLNSGSGEDTSDYALSKALGITQSRIRGFKVKCGLKQLLDFDWKKQALACLQKAKLAKDQKKLTISINDPNVHIEIQHYLESNGFIAGYTLNPKHLELGPAEFIALHMFCSGQSETKVIENLKSMVNEEEKISGYFEKSLGKSLLESFGKEAGSNLLSQAFSQIPILINTFSNLTTA